jgi:predicted site-specific integrase-resolvase
LGQRAAIYCRVSTADQTCARQEADLLAFAARADYAVIGVWKETASGSKDDRAERKKVLALAQARDIDVILVTELTRSPQWAASKSRQDVTEGIGFGCRRESYRQIGRQLDLSKNTVLGIVKRNGAEVEPPSVQP